MEEGFVRKAIRIAGCMFCFFMSAVNSQLTFDSVNTCRNYLVERTTADTADTDKTSISTSPIRLRVAYRGISSVTIDWMYVYSGALINYTDPLRGWSIEYKRGSTWYVSSMQELDTYTYAFTGLSSNSEYVFCVKACTDLDNGLTGHFSACLRSYTLPYMRTDSLIALIITCSYLGVLCLLGVVQWKRNSKQRRYQLSLDHEVDK